MNPVVGLDISKGESQVQAFLDKGKPYRKSFSIKHTLDGLDSLKETFTTGLCEIVNILSQCIY